MSTDFEIVSFSGEDIRWKQRFENFDRALQKLESAVVAHQAMPDNELIIMALIKAFEFTYELGWKTLKDYLKYGGVSVRLPREVIKQAFANELIKDGQAWIDMLQDRNLMAHTYDDRRAQVAVEHILGRYLGAIRDVHAFFREKANS